jgi:hypothetical protein
MSSRTQPPTTRNNPPALGSEFLVEIEQAIQRILDAPDAWERIVKNVHLCQVRRFPYGIVYFVKDDIVHVVAVMHLHRRPGYWKNRLKKMDP